MERTYEVRVAVKVDTEAWTQVRLEQRIAAILDMDFEADTDIELVEVETVDYEDAETRAAAERLKKYIADTVPPGASVFVGPVTTGRLTSQKPNFEELSKDEDVPF